ncbi:MAG TPA: alpha-L-fucosidase [Dyella sp.]|uniref:alpha-L-fucosidase n=1 Tax=Dyella sp. TaxID=1869338 RepID=UPI002F932407
MPASGNRLLLAQQAFMDLRFGMFIHLNMASFEQREWGDPHASLKLFNPKHLDARQWARAARSANMRYGCLTTKHHDGFCLWPTKTGSANVMQSSYPRDIVRAYVDAFRAEGLQPCLYFSMLDLRADIRPDVITADKVALIKAQLTELLTQYGPIPALIFDGWNASWSRIDYEQLPFRDIYDHIKRLQPDCLVAEHNAGRYPVPALYYTDIKEYEQHAGQVIPAGSAIPSQSGTTLQSDWFWKEDYPKQALRPAKQIVDEWLRPFNDNHCNLILNCAPNRDGLFDENVIERLAEIGKLWQHPGAAPKLAPALAITTENLAKRQPSFASSIADGSGPDLAFDDKIATYWEADAGQATAWLEVRLEKPVTFNTVSIIEPRHMGDYGEARIVHFTVQYEQSGEWRNIAQGTMPQSVALQRIDAVTARRVRLQLEGRGRSPGISEFGLYFEPVS